jgi:hypothetical protein
MKIVMNLNRFFQKSFFRKKNKNILVKNHRNGESKNARTFDKKKNIIKDKLEV